MSVLVTHQPDVVSRSIRACVDLAVALRVPDATASPIPGATAKRGPLQGHITNTKNLMQVAAPCPARWPTLLAFAVLGLVPVLMTTETHGQCDPPHQIAKLLPLEAQDPGDFFGWSVAIDGDTAVVGARNDTLSGGWSEVYKSGSAYVFVRASGAWTLQARLSASDAAFEDEFGASVAVSGDTVIVGAPSHDPEGLPGSGAAYVYVRAPGGSWSEQAKLVRSGATCCERFGDSVALAGNTALVGASNDNAAGPDAGAAYVFVRSGTTWTQQAVLTASDAAAYDMFGVSVAVSGDTAVVGAWGDDHSGWFKAGSAYVFVRSGTTWSEQAKLTASDAATYDQFGIAVAVSGDTALIGAYRDDHAGGLDAGSAYVFIRSGVSWTQQAKLVALDASPNDAFGCSVSLFGNTALIGAETDDDGRGAAYVFVRSGTTWNQQAKLTAPGAEPGDVFGFAVALSGDTALVGAYSDDLPSIETDAGSAHVFTHAGALWSHQARLTPTDSGGGEYMGYSVALEGDTAAVGAWGYRPYGLYEGGAAFVFTRTSGIWSQQAKLTASDAATNDGLGASIALSGETLLVGAPTDDHPVPGGAWKLDAGSAYVFVRSGTAWSEQAKLVAWDADSFHGFGSSVAISGDTAVIGAPGAGPFGNGAVYVYGRSMGMFWFGLAGLTAPDVDAVDNQVFGHAVAISSAGTIVVGAPADDNEGGSDAGAAYIYVPTGTLAGWVFQAKLVAPDAGPNDRFGWSVAIEGDTVIVGRWENSFFGGDNTGAAYVFFRTGGSWMHQATLVASDPLPHYDVGISVALSGSTALIGAFGGGPPGAGDAGSAYVFTRSGEAWSQRAKLTASDAEHFDRFGFSVALDGKTAVLGAPFDNGDDLWGELDAGSAYVFDLQAEGDLDADGDHDLNDLTIFVPVLLGLDTDPIHVERADVDCSGAADGLDIGPFVALLLPP